MKIRPAAVAGLFYPAEPQALRTELAGLLDAARAHAPSPPPRMLIVPHAGYRYSGAVAATAYAGLADAAADIRRVVLLGPAHRLWVAGLALPDAEAFATPLGDVPLIGDLDCIAQLPGVEISAAAHAEEHSLEVQLPFLQTLLEDFELLPILVGGATAEQVEGLLDATTTDPSTLVVISTDLSHFHADAEARRLDAATAAAIEAFDTRLQGAQACGARPLNGALSWARSQHLDIRRLGLANSADADGPADRVVGYGAWALTAAAA